MEPVRTLHESLETPVRYRPDVLVVGGGFAGIAAALAAARLGRRVLLAERAYMLGGLGTAGLIAIYLPICDGTGRQVSFGLAEELLRLSIADHYDGIRGADWLVNCAPDRATRAKGKRFALPNSEILIHQPLIGGQVGLQGQTTDIKIHADHMVRTRNKMNGILSACTGQPLERIEQDTERDNYMTAEEAKAYGLIDDVISQR